MNPKSSRLMEMAIEIVARLQPKSSCNGTINTLGADRNPDAPSKMMNVTAAITHA
jgi:hypothetical protein